MQRARARSDSELVRVQPELLRVRAHEAHHVREHEPRALGRRKRHLERQRQLLAVAAREDQLMRPRVITPGQSGGPTVDNFH